MFRIGPARNLGVQDRSLQCWWLRHCFGDWNCSSISRAYLMLGFDPHWVMCSEICFLGKTDEKAIWRCRSGWSHRCLSFQCWLIFRPLDRKWSFSCESPWYVSLSSPLWLLRTDPVKRYSSCTINGFNAKKTPLFNQGCVVRQANN